MEVTEMFERLKEKIDERFARSEEQVDARLLRNEDKLERRIAEAKADLEQMVSDVRTELGQRVSGVRDDLGESLSTNERPDWRGPRGRPQAVQHPPTASLDPGSRFGHGIGGRQHVRPTTLRRAAVSCTDGR